VVSFIARADVALSVVMTTCSTLAAVLLTPLLTALLAGQFVQVDTWGLFLSTVQVVILPVAGGVALNRLLPQAVASVLPIAPLVSVLMIALICGSIIAQNAAAVRGAGLLLLVAIVLLHVAGFGVGYLFARLVGYPTLIARTISIETGMQNSGLGVVLAQKHFASEPLTAVPGALSALTHSVIGSLLAAWWRWQAKTDESPGIARRIDDVADAGVAQTPGPDLAWSGDGDAGEVFTSVRAPAEQSLERVNRRRAGRLDAAPATGDAGRSPPR
jgi:BASS family bile acid:Na+ symporter